MSFSQYPPQENRAKTLHITALKCYTGVIRAMKELHQSQRSYHMAEPQ